MKIKELAKEDPYLAYKELLRSEASKRIDEVSSAGKECLSAIRGEVDDFFDLYEDDYSQPIEAFFDDLERGDLFSDIVFSDNVKPKIIAYIRELLC